VVRRPLHTDGWFAFSWGALPVLAGYILQTNSVSSAALLLAVSAGLLSRAEISASRPYKALKRAVPGKSGLDAAQQAVMQSLERVLRNLSAGVIVLGLGLLVWRWRG